MWRGFAHNPQVVSFRLSVDDNSLPVVLHDRFVSVARYNRVPDQFLKLLKPRGYDEMCARNTAWNWSWVVRLPLLEVSLAYFALCLLARPWLVSPGAFLLKSSIDPSPTLLLQESDFGEFYFVDGSATKGRIFSSFYLKKSMECLQIVLYLQPEIRKVASASFWIAKI